MIQPRTRNDTEGASAALVRFGRALLASGYRFTTPTPATHALVNARPGNEWAHDLAGVFGWSRPFRNGMLPPEIKALATEADLLIPHGNGQRSKLRASTLNDALFFHSAFPTLARDSVFFGPDTCKFVDAIQAWLAGAKAKPGRAVDICTGAGPGGLAIALAHPDASVALVDINDKALHLAGINARIAGARNATPRHSHLLSSLDGAFDLILAHPPYLVDAAARAYRDGGGALGAGLSLDIVRSAIERLAPGGTLLLFTGIAIVAGANSFAQAAGDLLDKAGLSWCCREVDPDVFGDELRYPAYQETDRIALCVLTATRWT